MDNDAKDIADKSSHFEYLSKVLGYNVVPPKDAQMYAKTSFTVHFIKYENGRRYNCTNHDMDWKYTETVLDSDGLGLSDRDFAMLKAGIIKLIPKEKQ